METSNSYGTNYNCDSFSDSDFLKTMKNIQITEIHLYDDGTYACGYEIFYKTCNQIVSSGLHCTVDVDNIEDSSKWVDYKGRKIKKYELKLEEDEYIDKVEIRSGAIIDRITLKSNKGKEISAGGLGGSSKTWNKKGCKFVGFNGSHASNENRNSEWSTIHDVSIVYQKI